MTTPGPTTLIASATYASTHPDTDVSGRLGNLQRAIDRLREATGSGWVGHQDDVTGYLGELSGGRYAAEQAAETPADATGTATAFLDEYAEDLFGVPAEEVAVARRRRDRRRRQHRPPRPAGDRGRARARRRPGDDRRR